jgi:cobalt-precorrin 5A hydrolase
VPTRSHRIEALRQVGSVAEAAALAAAGPGAMLLLRRIASAGATCALALRAQSVTQGP